MIGHRQRAVPAGPCLGVEVFSALRNFWISKIADPGAELGIFTIPNETLFGFFLSLGFSSLREKQFFGLSEGALRQGGLTTAVAQTSAERAFLDIFTHAATYHGRS